MKRAKAARRQDARTTRALDEVLARAAKQVVDRVLRGLAWRLYAEPTRMLAVMVGDSDVLAEMDAARRQWIETGTLPA
jgi:hypothetical protein